MARPFIPVPYVCAAEILQSLGSTVFSNVMYWEAPYDEWDAAHLIELSGAIITYWINHMLPLQGNDVRFIGVRAVRKDVEGATPTFLEVFDYYGGDASPSLPLNTAVFVPITANTLAGREHYGMVFGGVPESKVTANKVDLVYRKAVRDAWGYAVDIPTSFDAGWVRVSWQVNGAWRSEGYVTIAQNARVPRETVATRRQRLLNPAWTGP